MATRARIAQSSDVQVVRERSPKRAARPGRIAMLRLAVLLLVVASVYLSARLLGVGFFQGWADAAITFLVRVAVWARIALASGFQSIPVW